MIKVKQYQNYVATLRVNNTQKERENGEEKKVTFHPST